MASTPEQRRRMDPSRPGPDYREGELESKDGKSRVYCWHNISRNPGRLSKVDHSGVDVAAADRLAVACSAWIDATDDPTVRLIDVEPKEAAMDTAHIAYRARMAQEVDRG